MKVRDKIKVNYHYADCHNFATCRTNFAMAGMTKTPKNRNDARFWGLVEKIILCGACLGQRKSEMPPRKRYLWNEYKKRGYWKEEHKFKTT